MDQKPTGDDDKTIEINDIDQEPDKVAMESKEVRKYTQPKLEP